MDNDLLSNFITLLVQGQLHGFSRSPTTGFYQIRRPTAMSNSTA